MENLFTKTIEFYLQFWTFQYLDFRFQNGQTPSKFEDTNLQKKNIVHKLK